MNTIRHPSEGWGRSQRRAHPAIIKTPACAGVTPHMDHPK